METQGGARFWSKRFAASSYSLSGHNKTLSMYMPTMRSIKETPLQTISVAAAGTTGPQRRWNQ